MICSWLLYSVIVQEDRQFIKEELLWEVCGDKVDEVPCIFCFPNMRSLSTLVGYWLFMDWEKNSAIKCFPSSAVSGQSLLHRISHESTECLQGSYFQKKNALFGHSAFQEQRQRKNCITQKWFISQTSKHNTIWGKVQKLRRLTGWRMIPEKPWSVRFIWLLRHHFLSRWWHLDRNPCPKLFNGQYFPWSI